MGHSYTDAGGIGPFQVARSVPTGTTVRFTVTDSGNKLTDNVKMIRSVLNDAIQQFIDVERADLDTNGDTTVKGQEQHPGAGDGFGAFTYNFDGKWAQVALTALTSIDASNNITATIPFDDVA